MRAVLKPGLDDRRKRRNSNPLDLKRFAFLRGADVDLGAHARWVRVGVVLDFPEELGDAAGPFTDCEL